MIRAIHARGLLDALARTAEAGPIFDAVHRCLNEVDAIMRKEATESFRDRPIGDLEMSVRLASALRARQITTVRELEAKSAEELKGNAGPGSAHYFGKKNLKEVREVLASLGMKLKGDP